jgi:Na+-driven multidrug efflux pump
MFGTIKKYRGDGVIYKKILVVALPIVLQNVIDAAVNSVDVLMLNSVGQSAISAVSLANSMIGIFFHVPLWNWYWNSDVGGSVLW